MTSPKLTIFFPVYGDERTVERVTHKCIDLLEQLGETGEIIIIDDGSPDKSGLIADELAARYPELVRVIHHDRNLGYGSAIRTGLDAAKGEWICFTDGDDEYDVFDFSRLLKHRHRYDLIITFRYKKLYSSLRQFISYVYNFAYRSIFRTRYRDVSTGLRVIRSSLARELNLTSTSPFIGAELTAKSMLKGYSIGEVGIQTFPREFGKGSSTSFKNILATIRDMGSVYREVFSDDYDLPKNRDRKI